jgi:hypothetical protein
MNKTTYYIGLNDKDSKKQTVTTSDARRTIEKIALKYTDGRMPSRLLRSIITARILDTNLSLFQLYFLIITKFDRSIGAVLTFVNLSRLQSEGLEFDIYDYMNCYGYISTI